MRKLIFIVICLALVSCSFVKYENESGNLSKVYPANSEAPEACSGYGFRAMYVSQGFDHHETIAWEYFYLRPGKYSIGYYPGEYAKSKDGTCILLEEIQPHGRNGAYWIQIEVNEGCDLRLAYLAGSIVGVQECNNHRQSDAKNARLL